MDQKNSTQKEKIEEARRSLKHAVGMRIPKGAGA
jgi:hypothetical protein